MHVCMYVCMRWVQTLMLRGVPKELNTSFIQKKFNQISNVNHVVHLAILCTLVLYFKKGDDLNKAADA
jgi:hypothetical protein